MTFAGARSKKDRIEAGVYLPYRSTSPRFHGFLPYGRVGVHFLRIDAPDQIDEAVRRWLSDAHRLGKQESAKPGAAAAGGTGRRAAAPGCEDANVRRATKP